jgi:hypothetical protein
MSQGRKRRNDGETKVIQKKVSSLERRSLEVEELSVWL